MAKQPQGALRSGRAFANQIIVAPNGKAAHFIARIKGDGSQPSRPGCRTHGCRAGRAASGGASIRSAAVEKDGFLYGRGALDNKSAVAAYARAVLRLKREKVKADA